MPNYVTLYRLKPEGLEIKDGGHIHVENGGEVDLEAGSVFRMGGVAVNANAADLNKLAGIAPSAAAINVLVGGLAAGYRLARGVHETVAASDTVATGLTTVVAVLATLDDDPTVDPLFVTCSIGDQAGAPAAGSILIKSWKPTANDNVTPIAATTFSKKVNWVAIGT